MRNELLEFHKNCLPCQMNDKYPVRFKLGQVVRPRYPLHVVHCDLVVGLPKALDGSHAIFLLYDGFTRFVYGIALASEKAEYIVKKFMTHFVAAFGMPATLHSDNGKNIDGALVRHLCNLLGTVKTSTPPYSPRSNPAETVCGAIGMLIRKALTHSDKRYWPQCLPFVLNAYNSTVHSATGYTPNALFFGRDRERDPVPLVPFECETANANEYYQKIRRFQELAFQIVKGRNDQAVDNRKKVWDKTAVKHPFTEGGYVMVKDLAPVVGKGATKLRPKFLGPYQSSEGVPS